jgi:hypothetical protein
MGDDVLDVSKESVSMLVVVCDEKLARTDRVNIVGCTDERMMNGSNVLGGSAPQDMTEDFNLGTDQFLWLGGFRERHRRGVIDGVYVDCRWILRVV